MSDTPLPAGKEPLIDLDHLYRELEAAETRIRPHIRETYLEESPTFGRQAGGRVWFKLENFQHTGSFKARGAVNKLLTLTPEIRANGVITASTGNHGAAVGYALSQVGGRGTVYVPENASPAKLANISRWGIEIRTFGQDSVESERRARQAAEESGRPFISPYNDPDIVAGQGTIGLELVRQMPAPERVYIALGGGGLAAGVALALKRRWPQTRIIACSPENSAVMMASINAGRILELASRPTLSDGTAGGVEAGSITFPLCRALVDEFVTVSETEIAAAMHQYIRTERQIIEGAAGVALAGLLKRQPAKNTGDAAVILCGRNIDLPHLLPILTRDED